MGQHDSRSMDNICPERGGNPNTVVVRFVNKAIISPSLKIN